MLGKRKLNSFVSVGGLGTWHGIICILTVRYSALLHKQYVETPIFTGETSQGTDVLRNTFGKMLFRVVLTISRSHDFFLSSHSIL